jgi:hypothetical protein
MFALKPISSDSLDGALAKAERYRLLNEPSEAESICRDILEVAPANREARISLILALTDEFPRDDRAFASAMVETATLESAYDRAYYSGIAWERRAKAFHDAGRPGSSGRVYDWIVKALGLFEEAERQRPAGNDDPILRWNACVRFLERHKSL